jgi:glucose 1-dehydrogenase
MALDQLLGQVALITGAGQGIGFEIGREFGRRGAAVVLNDVDEELLDQAVGMLRAEGIACREYSGDAGEFTVIQGMIRAAVEHFGRLDIAVANAGITLFGNFLDYPLDSFDRVMRLNLGGNFFLAQQAALQMKSQGLGGSILFTSSVTGHQAHRNLAAYGMTKAALEMLARNLVVELSPHRITVNAIAPGATLTERTRDDPAYESTWAKITPLGRPATVQDIAYAAAFLVSSEARHITGQSLIIDGGWTSVSPSPYSDPF